MHILALIVGIAALVVFILGYLRSKALIELGLALLTAMLLLHFLIENSDPITF